jgi:hypothetical protein
MALLAGIAVAMTLAAFEIGIRTGWRTQMLAILSRGPALRAPRPQLGHPFSAGRSRRTSPARTVVPFNGRG